MIEWNCDANNCSKMTEVDDDYEPLGCCSGFECGCMGMQINPVFCEDCAVKLGYIEQPKESNND